MRLLRPLLNFAFLCLVAGIAGGLGLGLVLSWQGGWLTPAPWAIYAAVLAVLVVAISWLDEKRSARIAESAWPLAAGFTSPEQSGSSAATGLTPVDAEPDGLLGSALAAETPLEAEPGAEPLLTVVNEAPTAIRGAEPRAAEPASVDTWTVAGNGWVFAQDAPPGAVEAKEPEEEGLSIPVAESGLETVGDADHGTVLIEIAAERSTGASSENSKHVSTVAERYRQDGVGGGGEKR